MSNPPLPPRPAAPRVTALLPPTGLDLLRMACSQMYSARIRAVPCVISVPTAFEAAVAFDDRSAWLTYTAVPTPDQALF